MKRIELFINSLKTPYQIIIKTCDTKIVKTIYKNKSEIVFCTNSQVINIIAKYNNISEYKTICLDNSCKIFLNFSFTIVSSQIPVNFTLTDSNYGLPVKEATITFK